VCRQPDQAAPLRRRRGIRRGGHGGGGSPDRQRPRHAAAPSWGSSRHQRPVRLIGFPRRAAAERSLPPPLPGRWVRLPTTGPTADSRVVTFAAGLRIRRRGDPSRSAARCARWASRLHYARSAASVTSGVPTPPKTCRSDGRRRRSPSCWYTGTSPPGPRP
jgi:hypothetical protein